ADDGGLQRATARDVIVRRSLRFRCDVEAQPRMRRLIGFAAVGVSTLLVACVHIASARTPPRGPLSRQVAAGNGAARDCGPKEARRLVSSFIRAFNAGDGARLDSLLAED